MLSNFFLMYLIWGIFLSRCIVDSREMQQKAGTRDVGVKVVLTSVDK